MGARIPVASIFSCINIKEVWRCYKNLQMLMFEE
jgi:hypothetical protein